MIPIDSDDYLMLVTVLTDYVATLTAVSKTEPEVTQDRKDRIEHAEAIKLALLKHRYVVMDTRPRCMVNDEGTQCEGVGRYQPFVFVYSKGLENPLAQLSIQPILRICERHATSDLGKYLSQDAWKDIQLKFMKQAGKWVYYDQARVMYLDHENQTMIPPPAPKIVTVN